MSLCWVILGGRLRGLSKLQERRGEKNAWHAEKSKPCLSTPTGSGRERGLTVSYVLKINRSRNYAIHHRQRVLYVWSSPLKRSVAAIFYLKIIQRRAASYYGGDYPQRSLNKCERAAYMNTNTDKAQRGREGR